MINFFCRAAGGFLFLLNTFPAYAGQIWVAPNGNDDAPGTQKQPLATPQRAR